jgi:transposase-like protein
MSKKRHSPEFKAKVALEALKGVKPLHALASEAGVHPVQITQWKKRAQELVAEGFRERRKKEATQDEKLKEELYKQIGQMKVELDWLKKKSGLFD